MTPYIVGLTIVAAIFLIPRFRRAALSLLGIAGIAALGITGIGIPVWALYEAKPWLISPEPAVADLAPAAAEVVTDTLAGTQDKEASSTDKETDSQLTEEAEQQAEELSQTEATLPDEEEQNRIAGIAETARSVVARDREYAVTASSSPQIAGLDGRSTNLISIRIPRWRDGALAEREKGLIRAWLHSIGLSPLETVSIYTAHGWGSVYELWRRENRTANEGPTSDPQAPVASAPDPLPTTEPEPEPTPIPKPAPRQAEPRTLDQRSTTAPRPVPQREATAPRRTVPTRRPPPAREAGPFGY